MFSDESRFSLSSDSRRVTIWRERGTRFEPRNIMERHSFPSRGVMARAGIMMDGRTDLHFFDTGSMTAQRYRDEVLEPYDMFGEKNSSPFAPNKLPYRTEESSSRGLEPFESTTHSSSHSNVQKAVIKNERIKVVVNIAASALTDSRIEMQRSTYHKKRKRRKQIYDKREQFKLLPFFLSLMRRFLKGLTPMAPFFLCDV
ncbi:transposable element Tcb2 transposase [Trichonephila clavipes]|nr:transposable element Tcb2 transposase [Trichonephila clavipes]